MYLEALKLAFEAHDGQLRKQSCVPYIVHPVRVANCFNDDEHKTLAVLHDVLEDTDITLDDIIKKIPNISGRVLNALAILTKQKQDTHIFYIKKIAVYCYEHKDNMALEVKIADIVDNLSDNLCICQPSMAKRYRDSLKILLSHRKIS